MKLESSVNEIKGIGPRTSECFKKLDVNTCGDLLHDYPRTYVTYKDIIPVESVAENYMCAVCGVIKGRILVRKYGSKQIALGKLSDSTGSISFTFFNMPYIRNVLTEGGTFVLYGKVKRNGASFVMEQPEYFTPEDYERKRASMQPLYHLTTGLKNSTVVKSMHFLLDDEEIMSELDEGGVPVSEADRYGLCSYRNAVSAIHFPESADEMIRARKRLSMEEFLPFILSFRYKKDGSEKTGNKYPVNKTELSERFRISLPYELTDAQSRVWHEIRNDMTGGFLMNRLVQGDVGSGKTVVAVLALLAVIDSGYQGALMAPTEVLARQHYEKISAMLKDAGINIKTVLLTGSVSASMKKTVRACIACGDADLIIGTHAIIQEGVEFNNLGLAVIDEQHRFGVRQREILKDKGNDCHMLVMSATPIPRTLALIIYGDMDISAVNELPGNRLPIKNCAVNTAYRSTAYKFIEKQVREGRQCYIICPLVEAGENVDGEDVISYTEKLKGIFPSDITAAYLHGRMKNEEKNRIMEAFYRNEINILVSTTVIEVGIDVPNATVMMVENAERFGLSTLHQLRGRVGRGGHQSYCIFIDGSNKKESNKKLEVLAGSNDGFYIAEEDLKLRGPGEFFGERQSGMTDFEIGDIYADADVLKNASDCADRILETDPELILPEHRRLKEKVLEKRASIIL